MYVNTYWYTQLLRALLSLKVRQILAHIFLQIRPQVREVKK